MNFKINTYKWDLYFGVYRKEKRVEGTCKKYDFWFMPKGNDLVRLFFRKLIFMNCYAQKEFLLVIQVRNILIIMIVVF